VARFTQLFDELQKCYGIEFFGALASSSLITSASNN